MEPGTDLTAVARNDVCEFGRWLLAEAEKGNRAARMDRAHAAHTIIHREAAAVLAAVAAEDLTKARTLLTAEDGYAGSIAELTEILGEWARELNV